MKLFLSSYGLGDHIEELKKMARGTRVALVTNALDASPTKKKRWEVEYLSSLQEHGFCPKVLDLRNYFGKSEKRMHEELCKFDIIWVTGGNAFVLMRAIEQSGGRAVLNKLLNDGDLVYAGFSAGTVVAAENLDALELLSPPNIVPAGYPIEKPQKGLGFIPFNVVVHVDSPHLQSHNMAHEIEYYSKRDLPFIKMRDGDVLVARDNDFILMYSATSEDRSIRKRV